MKDGSKKPENTIEKINFDELDSIALILSGESKKSVSETIDKISQKVLGENYSNHPDNIKLEATNKKSIGIEEVKNLISRLKFKPYSAPKKLAMIENAEDMTLDAQNSLLKTLEDIPSKTIIILTTQNYQKLLPTIVSRCQVFEIHFEKDETQESLTEFNLDPKEILTLSLFEKYKIVEDISKIKSADEKRGVVKNLIESLTKHFEKELKNSKEAAAKLKLLHQTMKAVEENVNLRLALENLMINLEE